ncbi:MAG: DUF4331 domain-containing protein [Actinomycetota bacterium]|nr:DUF4331 domain-containing protein [Actinomycetota bacterium]
MSRSTRPAARRRALALFAATATAASGAALLGPSTSSASSHREAPYILNDPAVDNTDTYAFVSPNDAGKVTLIANWAPFSDPTGGPNFYPWDTSAAYDINIDNDGDAKPDIVYRWTFSDVDTRGVVDRGVGNGGKGTILYADGPVTSLTDENLRFRQTYDLVAIAEGGASVSLVNDGKVAPSNVGKATIPDYAALREAAITGTSDGGKSYVGQADDPFFIDLRVFDLLYGGDLSEVGDDTLAGYNVNTVALELPKELLVANKDAAANPVIGVWSTTSREKTRVFADTNAAPSTSTTDSSDETADSGNLVQISRLGNPLVNEAVVPANLRDLFNRSTPDRDAQFLGKVQDPEVPALIELLYKIPNPNKLDSAPAKKRNDLVGSFLTGFSKDVFAGTTFGGLGAGVVDADLNSLDINAVSPSPAPAEYLRLNVNVPLTAEPNRLGVVGGDLAGFPNGRRLSDDIVDIELQVFEGVLIRPEGDLKTAVAGLGDAVNKNDRKFLNTFPFIADPHSGSDVECARANRPGNGNAKACGQAAAQGKKK